MTARILGAWFLASLAAGVSVARAQSPSAAPGTDRPGITVTGIGQAQAKPNAVEIELSAAGASELAGDALVKYHDTKRRVLEGFAELKISHLKITAEGAAAGSVVRGSHGRSSVALGRVAADESGKQQLVIVRTVRLVLNGVQDVPEDEMMATLGKLIDKARDLGVATSATPLNIQFVLEDFGELRDQAYQRAVADARGRARSLARLSGVGLGPVESIEEVGVSGDEPAGRQSHASSSDAPRLASTHFAPVPVRVKLRVRFRMTSSDTETVHK